MKMRAANRTAARYTSRPQETRTACNVAPVALIKKFVHRPGSTAGFRSEVECGYRIVHDSARTLLHLETYGSSDRAIPGKVSQSLQLDRNGARQLRDLIDRAFPDVSH